MRKEKYYFVYINTNKTHTVLYTGITNNLLNTLNYETNQNPQSGVK